MTKPPQPRARIGRPARISRKDIVEAALRVIDRDGVERLTMRQLANAIGTTPMAIYYHVRNKDELLLLLLDHYASGVQIPPLPEDPRERLIAAALVMHDVLAECPWIVEVLTTDDLTAVSALWIVETIVDSAVRCGLTPEKAVHAYRTIWYYTAGEIIIRATSRQRRSEPEGPLYRDQIFADLDAERLPQLASLADQWAILTAQDTFRVGLEALVAGLLDAFRKA
jgi:AcrR family transcriptional regulator